MAIFVKIHSSCCQLRILPTRHQSRPTKSSFACFSSGVEDKGIDEVAISATVEGVQGETGCASQAVSPTALENSVMQIRPEALHNAISVQGPLVLIEGGWLWAVGVVFAIRLGRLSADESRLDTRKVQFERESRRALGKELMEKRRQWQEAEFRRITVEDARRVEEAALKAREHVQAEKRRQKRYQEEAARQTEKLRAERETKRAEYESKQAVFENEMKRRTEQEQKLLEQKRAAARAEEESRRLQREREQKRREEERRQRDAEEQRLREDAIRKKIETRRRVEKEKKRFAMRLEGSVVFEKPPKGTIARGPLQKPAQVRLIINCSTLLSGPLQQQVLDVASTSEIPDVLPGLVGQQCRAAAQAHVSGMRLQNMVSDDGPLLWMDNVELTHWEELAATKAAVAGLRAAERALEKRGEVVAFQVRSEYAVLPKGHDKNTADMLRRAIHLIEQGDVLTAKEAVLAEMLEFADEEFYSDLYPLPAELQKAPKMLGSALVMAHLLNRTSVERPALVSDAPAWFEAAVGLMRRVLAESVSSAPADSLAPMANLLLGSIGFEHPVARELRTLADSNESAAVKRQRSDRAKLQEAELAARLLEEEWPDENEMKALRAEEREARTPVPERTWALRNVANTLALGGPGERGRARELLERAVLLKQKFAGSVDHPGTLPELSSLVDLLSSTEQWKTDAAGAASLAIRICRNMSDAYQKNNDPVSASILLYAALQKYEEIAGLASASVKSAARQADVIMDTLSSDQRTFVSAASQKGAEIIERIVGSLTDELGAYQSEAGKSKVQEWNERGVQMIGRLDLT